MSAVLRFSVRYCSTLACMSCSCRLITSRSVTLARASTRMRRLLMQQQAVRMSLQSCSLITPARSSVCCNTAWVSFKVLRVFVSLCTCPAVRGDPVPHCESVSVLSFSLFVFLVFPCACCPVGFVSSCLLWLCGLAASFCSVCSSRFWCGFRCFRVACSPLLFSLFLSFSPPLPACGLFCALVQLTLLYAGASLGVSGCSCDGSVTLLSCWVYGLALFPSVFRIMATKALCPVWGFLLSTP